MILPLVAALLSQMPDYSALREGRGTREVRALGRASGYAYADFELAPPTGAGMGAPCACTTITGAQGETFSFTRASQGWCNKKGDSATGAVTGIVEGDLVVCAVDQPAVEPMADGVLGFRSENTRQNPLLRSEELENAAWATTTGAGCTTTTNAVNSPAGGLSAERLQCASGAFNGRGQTIATAVQARFTFSAFVKDLGSSNGVTLRMTGTGNAGGDRTCEAQAISSTTWTRVVCASSASYGVGITAITVEFLNSTTNTGRNFDGYVWGAMLEVNPNTSTKATSYIQTSTIAVTRAATGNLYSGPLPMVPSSWAASVDGIMTDSNRQLWVGLNATYIRGWVNGSGNWEADRDSPSIAATDGTASSTGRLAGRYVTQGASATVTACADGTCGSTTTSNSTTAATSTAARWGYNSALGYYIDGIIGRICVDDDLARCL